MVQAEVGERLAAPPGSKIYGSPSAKAAWYGDFALAGSVSRQVFWPVPNVDSVLVKFERHAEPGTPDERRATFAIIDAAFQQRRKMLRQALVPLFGPDATARLEAAGDRADRARRATRRRRLPRDREGCNTGPVNPLDVDTNLLAAGIIGIGLVAVALGALAFRLIVRANLHVVLAIALSLGVMFTVIAIGYLVVVLVVR